MKAIFGTKVGMTQVFGDNNDVIPVTVLKVKSLFVTQIKSAENDGYSAVQVGLLKKRYMHKDFSLDWVKKKKRYFDFLQELPIGEKDGASDSFSVGAKVTLKDLGLDKGSMLQVTGRSKGLGFQGVMKRWNFGGGPATHGSTFHRQPGAVGHMRRQGEVIKGKKLPGRCGGKTVTVKGLRCVKIDYENDSLFIGGAIPGKKGSLITVKVQGM